jgi:threonine synthase
VPRAIADFVILDILRASGGCAVAVTDEELVSGAYEMTRATGICACPEGGACVAALRRLVSSGWIGPDETTLLFNTGTGIKYTEALSRDA